MPLPLIRYQLDPTGTNSDNAIVGEVHTLSTRPIRAIAPIYGPFFTESVSVSDNITNRLLVRGPDYVVVELLQDATLKYGKEIAQLILILNASVSADVRINYQVLGGLFQNNAAGIVTMYETVMKDNRPVDWTNVLNQPFEYPPTLHQHLLEDVYGFEPVVVALERIRNAIVLTDVPAFEALIEWVKRRFKPTVSEYEIDQVQSVDKVVTFERLLYALDKLNFNAITIDPTITKFREGNTATFNLSTTNLPDGTILYWSVEHITTSDSDFASLSGLININGNRGSLNLSIAREGDIEEPDQTFRILIHKNSTGGPVLAKTGILTIKKHGVADNMMVYMTTGCIYSPLIQRTPASLYVLGSLNF
jgi:hypothetical protein